MRNFRGVGLTNFRGGVEKYSGRGREIFWGGGFKKFFLGGGEKFSGGGGVDKFSCGLEISGGLRLFREGLEFFRRG